ncbi:MAG: hybrid sensor histidine kinase/response regulator [bacterium]|nr:hybrid sensor histidine kinase/response regulator [bacterium]
MNFNLGLTISGLIYLILIIIIYYKRKRIKTKENKVYSLLLITTLIELILGIFSYIFIINLDLFPNITRIINILYLITLDSWILYFLLYILSISSDFKSKKLYKIFWILYIIINLLISVLPINYYYKNNIMYTNGLSVNFTYFIAVVSIVIIIINSLINLKKLNNKKYIPMFIFLLLGTIVLFFQIKYPELFLISPLEVFVTVLMYFTIENPDKKIIEEIHRAKEISDNANEEKSLFLYNMTGVIRDINNNINMEANSILNETDNKKINIDLIKNSARQIKINTSKFTTMTNEILDISSIDSASIKIYNEKYNIKLILNKLINIYSKKCNNKNIIFKSNIDSDIPESLYGDGINLNKVLNILLENSLKNTNEGYIELNVNSIVKNDVVRLIINIEDTGIGIEAEELEKLFNINDNYKEETNNLNNTLYNAKKLITLMSGTIIPSSIYGKGTTMKIILDQKLVPNSNIISKYEKEITKNNILLIGTQNSKIIKNYLNKENINLDIVQLGKTALDKIRKNAKYDLILIEENIKPIDGITVMNKLLKIKEFKTNVILLSDNKNYLETYKNYGFSDIIVEPIKKELFIKTIDKYLE